MDDNSYEAALDLYYNRGSCSNTKAVVKAMANYDDKKVKELLLNDFDYYYAKDQLKFSDKEARAYVKRNPGLQKRREEEYDIYKNGL